MKKRISDYVRKGDPEAIALLLAKAVEKQKITVRADRKQDILRLLFESETVPDAQQAVHLTRKLLPFLQNTSFHTIKIYGRRTGQEKPAWFRTLYPESAIAPPLSATGIRRIKECLHSFFYYIRFSLAICVIGILCIVNLFAWYSVFTDHRRVPEIPPVPEESPVSEAEMPQISQREQEAPLLPAVPACSVSIKAVGDIIPGTDYPHNRLPPRPEILFQDVAPYLKGADILFGNFESTLTDNPVSAKNISSPNTFAFRTPPAYAEILKKSGFDILNVANNHSGDFYESGFKDTVFHITSAGMKAVGQKGEILFGSIRECRIAFIAFSPYDRHNSLHDSETAENLIRKTAEYTDIIVISVHAGAEGSGAVRVKKETEYYCGENRGNIRKFAHLMIDAGADLILGHGPHVIRALEIYKGKLIAYSLGNFLGYRTLSNAGNLKWSVILEVRMDERGDFIRGKMIPIEISRQGIPFVDNTFQSIKLIRKLTESDFPETPLSITADGEIFLKS